MGFCGRSTLVLLPGGNIACLVDKSCGNLRATPILKTVFDWVSVLLIKINRLISSMRRARTSSDRPLQRFVGFSGFAVVLQVENPDWSAWPDTNRESKAHHPSSPGRTKLAQL